MRFVVKLGDEAAQQLLRIAEAQRRPLCWQAAVLLEQALGSWPPCCSDHDDHDNRGRRAGRTLSGADGCTDQQREVRP